MRGRSIRVGLSDDVEGSGTAMATMAGPEASASDDARGFADLHRRMRQISGQVAGIDRMIADERPCGEVLVQIAAVQGALHAVGYRIFSDHIRASVGAVAEEAAPATDIAWEITVLADILGRASGRPKRPEPSEDGGVHDAADG